MSDVRQQTPDTSTIVASEALSAGAFVNVWSSTGFKVRNADATVAGKHAMGYVLASVASGGSAIVYSEGINPLQSGLTAGDVYLSTTPGLATNTPPAASGNIVQCIGYASNAATVRFLFSRPVTLA